MEFELVLKGSFWVEISSNEDVIAFLPSTTHHDSKEESLEKTHEEIHNYVCEEYQEAPFGYIVENGPYFSIE